MSAAGRLGAWLMAMGLLLGACDRKEPEPPQRSAPSFQLETLDHRRFYLNDHRGKPVVLVFWDTSCAVCKQEMVQLEALRKRLGAERVVMASVCIDPENIDAARRMLRGLGVGYPTLLDRGGRIRKEYGVGDLPTTVLISSKGKIILSREGFTEPLIGQLQSAIEGQL